MLKFLQKKANSWHEKLTNIGAGLLLCAIWVFVVVLFYNWLFAVQAVELPFKIKDLYWGTSWQMMPFYKHPILIDVFLGLLMAPLWEEVVFRHLPMRLIRATGKKISDQLLVPAMLFTSVIFGLGHYGVPSLLIQGVSGLVMSIVYVKNGYSYWSSVLFHACWNGLLMIGLINL